MVNKRASFDSTHEVARTVYDQYGPVSVPDSAVAGFRQSSDAAWDCLEGCLRHRMEDGTVMVPDTLGRWHRLSPVHPLIPIDDLSACAFQKDGSWAVLSPTLMLVMASAGIGIWIHPGFEAGIGDPACLTLPPIPSGVPLGFEQLLPQEDRESDFMVIRRQWLAEARRNMCPVRFEMAMVTVREAGRWIWAHELGHLLGGHTLLEVGGRADLRVRGGEQHLAHHPLQLPEVALEILADRFAARLLTTNTAKGADARLHGVRIGGLLAISLFETENVISGGHWSTSTHPGNWFRALEFLDETGGPTRCPFDDLPMLTRMANALGHCGQWLIPAFDGAYNGVARQFVEEALASLMPYSDALRANGAEPLRDGLGISTDMFDHAST